MDARDRREACRLSGSTYLDIRNVSKSFGRTKALEGVSFSIEEGECRAIMGRNGAGKSTLISLIVGDLTPDAGEVLIEGRPSSQARSIVCVYQRSHLIPDLTVAENISFRSYPHRIFGSIDWSEVGRSCEQHLEPWGLAYLAGRMVRDIDPVQKKVVEICRALAKSPKVLLLDEPTAGLARRDADRLYSFVDSLKAQNVTIIYVSHHLDEVYRLCETATVLRDGQHILTEQLGKLEKQSLVSAMVGSDVKVDMARPLKALANTVPHKPTTDAGKTGVAIEGLTVPGAFTEFSLNISPGECIGMAGLEGSGKAEIAAALAGLIKPTAGRVTINGRPLKLGDVRSHILAGVGYVPQDRHLEGMVQTMSVSENATLTAARRLARVLIPGVLTAVLSHDRDRAFDQLARKWRLVAASPDQRITELSGGNQQKCVLARAFATEPTLLVLQNPTAGVDVAAKASIMETLRDVLAEGASAIVVSEDADDFSLAERVVIISNGSVTTELGSNWTDTELVTAMQGGNLE